MRNKSILIVTSSIDYTVDYLIEHYSQVQFYRLNVDMIEHYEIVINNEGWSISSKSGYISNKDIKSIYYRKPMIPNLDEYDGNYHQMIVDDIMALVVGLVESFQGLVITRPSILRKCENKIYQLCILSQTKSKFPISCIGNMIDMDGKIDSHNKVIKPLTHGKIDHGEFFEVFQTNILTTNVGNISKTPVYIQEQVKGMYEVRVTCVNGYSWSVRIDTSEEVDWRRSVARNIYSLISMPEHIENLCFEIMNLFNLDFGAFDFIVKADGEWIFLELNPNGQWLWLELELNLDISKHLVEGLNGECI